MVEGGQNNAGNPTIAHPAYFLANLAPGSTTNLFYQTNKSAAVADRELILPSGGVLGGGSSTNFMMYSRAQKSDFDAWGVPGWSGADMLPYMKKVGIPSPCPSCASFPPHQSLEQRILKEVPL
jgi:choline dehydrogenase-like flavoprotein